MRQEIGIEIILWLKEKRKKRNNGDRCFILQVGYELFTEIYREVERLKKERERERKGWNETFRFVTN